MINSHKILEDPITQQELFENIHQLQLDIEANKLHNPSQIDLSILMNKIINNILKLCTNISIKIKILNMLLGYEDGKYNSGFISKFFGNEIVPLYLINVIKDNKLSDDINFNNDVIFLQQPLIYDNLSHNLRRVYKLLFNNFYNYLITQEILLKYKKCCKSGESKYNYTYLSSRPYIISFLYYPSQDASTHSKFDCFNVLIKTYENLLNFAILDTKNILQISLELYSEYIIKKNNITTTQDELDACILGGLKRLYDYLVEFTFKMSEEDLSKIVINSLEEYSAIYEKNKTKNFEGFSTCVKENLELSVKNFIYVKKDIFKELNSSNIKKNIESHNTYIAKLTNIQEGGFKKRYIELKKKYKKLYNIGVIRPQL